MPVIEAESVLDPDVAEFPARRCTPRKLDVESVEDLARLYAEDVRLPRLQVPLCELIDGLQAITYLAGTGLVSREGDHLSIYALADLKRSDAVAQQALGIVATTYNQFAKQLHEMTPIVRSRLGFYHTTGANLQGLTKNLKRKWVQDPSVSLMSVLLFR